MIPRFLLLGAANFAAMGMGFAVALIVVRYFGAGGLGQMALAQSLVAFAMTAAIWGTDLYAIPRVAARPDLLWPTIRTVRVVRGIAATAAFAVVVMIAFLVPDYRDVRLLVILFGLSTFASIASPEWVPQSEHRTGVTAIASLANQSIFLIGVLALVVGAGTHLWGVPAAKVGADVAITGGLLLWLAHAHPRDRIVRSAQDLRAFAIQSAPICATQILRSISLTSDVIILGLVATRTELGYYAGASKFFLLMIALATAYFVILLPRLAERSHSTPDLLAELKWSLRLTVPVALGGVITLALISERLLVGLFGPGFESATVALQLLGFAAVANLVSRHFRQILLVSGRQTTDLRMTIGGALTHITAKVVLIPLLGITGAALGTLLGEAFLMVAHGLAARSSLTGPVPQEMGVDRSTST